MNIDSIIIRWGRFFALAYALAFCLAKTTTNDIFILPLVGIIIFMYFINFK
jgi:hypothetical protein